MAHRCLAFRGGWRLAVLILLDVPSDNNSASSFGALHGLYWLVANLAEQDRLLLVSTMPIGPMSRRCGSSRTWRGASSDARGATHRCAGGRADDNRPAVLAELVAEPSSELLTPVALGEPAVAELCEKRGRAGGRVVCARLPARVGWQPVPSGRTRAKTPRSGRPVHRSAPAAWVRSRRRRWPAPHARGSHGSGSARALAQATVVIGDAAPLELVGELAGLERDEAARAADRLIEAGLFEPGHPLRFRHPLLRSAVAVSLTLSESEATHRRAADLLRERGEPPERIAVHLLATTATGRATMRRSCATPRGARWLVALPGRPCGCTCACSRNRSRPTSVRRQCSPSAMPSTALVKWSPQPSISRPRIVMRVIRWCAPGR